MAKFASGKWAWGICDGCGGSFRLNILKEPTLQGVPTGMLKCHDCFDPEHGQDQELRIEADAEALRRSRPDTDQGRDLTGTLTYPPINGVV